ncbi:signal peptidase I [Weissella uvarum]|uniref:signal peptidase I n=1 Tax=Weissella uvarum TaxID=1479233 RepID=UPI0019606847|nr:signal peptidase I [Weissella uvarum]MBM7616952.1 signal peptidase I [Weissella uvarum]MCM0594599.1 signal peptidase I [Weissella uvarum]
MKTIKNILSWIIPVVIGLVIAGLVTHFVVSFVRVDGTSMAPNLSNNERVVQLVNGKVRRGSVIVFNAEGEDPSVKSEKKYVKRVIAVPGDTVSANNGQIKVNGKVVNQNYISESEQYATNYPGPTDIGNWTNLKQLGTRMEWQKTPSVKVPKGKYFVLGDHRSVSNDSRYWGFVDKNKVTGVVKVPFWDNSNKKAKINDQWKHYFE